MDLSHLMHLDPENKSSPEATFDNMNSSPEHTLDQSVDAERVDPSTFADPNRLTVPSTSSLLPFRPLRIHRDTETLQVAAQSQITSEVQNSKEVTQPEPESSNAVTPALATGCTPSFLQTPPDTLVFLDYPNTARFSEYVGLNVPLRIHSAKLLGTGSKVFRELLSPTKNFRTIRRRKLVNRLPEGIKFCLDLTPPDEGDEAVDLTADLSLSLGIRQWHGMSLRRIITNVGGSDESADCDLIPLLGLEPPARPPSNEGTYLSAPRNKIPNYRPDIPEYSNIRHRQGIQRLLQVIGGKDPKLDSAAKVWNLWVLAKYFDCTISVVDYISKWLLAEPNSLFVEILPEMTAKMGLGLQTHAVSRAAFSVLVGEEALALVCRRRPTSDPELSDATRLGRRKEDIDEDLKTRLEYASKTFEERISTMFEDFWGQDLHWLDQLPEFKKITKFLDAIDESADLSQFQWARCIKLLRRLITSFIRGRILDAMSYTLNYSNDEGKSFMTRRHCEALDTPSSWAVGDPFPLYNKLSLPERAFTRPFWKKLRVIGFTLNDSLRIANEESIDPATYTTLTMAAENFDEAVIQAIKRGFLNSAQIPSEAITTPSNPPELGTAKQENNTSGSEESFESQKSQANLGPVWGEQQTLTLDGSFGPIPEYQQPPCWYGSHCPHPHCRFTHPSDSLLAPTSDLSTMAISGDAMTTAVSQDLRQMNLTHRNKVGIQTPTPALPGNNLRGNSIANNQYLQPPLLPSKDSNPPKMEMSAPNSRFFDEDSPFLNLRHLFHQVDNYIKLFCDRMLSTRTMGFEINTTDVLVCLTDNEFKYLPIFAGGQDDGTGLVFTDPVPEGTNGLVPIGPGPSFRTGFSMAGDSASSVDGQSEFSFGGDTDTSAEMEQGSNIVEDGFSGIFPRMRMAIDSDVASVAWSGAGGEMDSEVESGKGKGVVRAKAWEIGPVFTPTTSVVDDNGTDSIAGDSNSNANMRDTDMEMETISKLQDTMVDNLDMTESVAGVSDEVTTDSTSTVIDEDSNFSNYDHKYGYGHEDNDDEEAEDNDTTIANAGDLGDIGDVSDVSDVDDIDVSDASDADIEDVSDVDDDMDITPSATNTVTLEYAEMAGQPDGTESELDSDMTTQKDENIFCFDDDDLIAL